MKYRIAILALSILVINYLYAQNTCICGLNLLKLSEKIEQNHPGFLDKIQGGNKYAVLKDSLLNRSSSITNIYDCSILLREYINFFKDPHLTVSMDFTGLPADSIRKITSYAPAYSIQEDSLRQYFQSVEKKDPIEGIWELAGATTKYTIAITSGKIDKNNFTGLILESDGIYWKHGQIKLSASKKNGAYDIMLFNRSHTPISYTISDAESIIDIGMQGYWRKIFPTTTHVQRAPFKTTYTQLSAKTAILRLPAFSIEYKNEVDSVLEKNWKKIITTKNLIIDIRGNKGGSGATFQKSLSLLYTNPIKIEAGIVTASGDNIKYYKSLVEKMSDSDFSKTRMKALVELLESNIGKQLSIGDTTSIRYGKVLKYPAKIAILTDEQTASAAELLLLWAKQSKKVTIYGRNTRGAIDYGNAIEKADLPCSLFRYTYPLLKRVASENTNLDEVGIKPDMTLNYTIPNWVSYVQRILEN
jgi:hypothetical protein